jgi:hypothetical protein
MRRAAPVVAAVSLILAGGAARAQQPPGPLPRVVLDLHGIIPVFPNDSVQLADSRGLTVTELPGAGLGGRVGAHLYLFKYRAITFGIGGEALVGASGSTPVDATAGLVPVDARLKSADAQVSVNFGSAHGWSYLSGGAGRSTWSIAPAGGTAGAADSEGLPTTNYGGGAHWSIKRHLGFSLDVRIYEIQPGTPHVIDGVLRPGSPRTRLFVVGAGVFLK